jgi:sodium-coupled monocarboxylate transporter 8/12
METLKRFKGLPGIFLACVFSGALRYIKSLFYLKFYVDICSTLSSGLNSLAAVVLSDIIKFFYRKEMTDKQDLWYSKVLCKFSLKNIFLLFYLLILFSTCFWCCLYIINISCFITWKSSSSNFIFIWCFIRTYKCNIYDWIFSSMD